MENKVSLNKVKMEQIGKMLIVRKFTHLSEFCLSWDFTNYLEFVTTGALIEIVIEKLF